MRRAAALSAGALILAAAAAASDMGDWQCLQEIQYRCPYVRPADPRFAACRKKHEDETPPECAERQTLDSGAMQAMAEQIADVADYSGWRYASSPVSDELLEPMSLDQLRVFRNTYFAGHGRVFKDARLDEYFRTFRWYKPRAGSPETDLSAIEKANVSKIADYERRLEERRKRSAAKGKRPARMPFPESLPAAAP